MLKINKNTTKEQNKAKKYKTITTPTTIIVNKKQVKNEKKKTVIRQPNFYSGGI